MSRYYIAADGGDSRLQAILYDKNFRIIRHGRVAGVNSLFKPIDIIRTNVESMIKDLLQSQNGEPPITEIAAADLCLAGAGDIAKEALSGFAVVQQLHFHSEPVVGLAAASGISSDYIRWSLTSIYVEKMLATASLPVSSRAQISPAETITTRPS